ncbi:peroxisomal 2 4-dienoyl-CoA reductase sps19 [Kluyveromyces marxianus]|nr:peroxisomal 2 4-dienoyl-CoA reductase sps19 [Kluyveromyces marxianus]KAG0685424.1 peroxisomal 2 4-dienoyl-CoA reductase sps19 [Kluyveromyces marxianus]
MPNTIDKSFVENGPWKPNMFFGKVVFVTGGAGTICRVQTEAMVILGCKAAIVGRNLEKTKKTAAEIASLVNDDHAVLPISGVDVRNVEQLHEAVKLTVQRFGRVDYVIAGAAGNFLADFTHLSANAFKSVVSIDLLGSFNTVKACFPELVKTKGAVLFVSATLHYYGVPFQAHVGAAKAGIDALSNSLAVEMGPLGIRFNVVAPGAIANTEGLSRLTKKGSESSSDLTKMIPLQRLGTTVDIANTTVFLFSPAASYVTGATHVVDGGAWHVGSQITKDLYPQELHYNFSAKL